MTTTISLPDSPAGTDPAGAAEAGTRLLRAAAQTYLDEIDALARRTRATLALAAAPGPAAPGALAEAARRSIPRWHFEMLNDVERNDSLTKAVAAAVRPGDHVLDIGSGTGLLALTAAQSGAARVTTCEANPLLAEIARQVVEVNGFSDVITVVHGWSTDLDAERDLGGRVDLVVSEIVDCGLVGEGLLGTVRHAREHLLAPGGRMVPEGARIMGRLVESEAAVSLNRVDTAAGFDVSLLNLVATAGHFPLRTRTRDHRFLSPAGELAAFDLFSDPLTDGAAPLLLPVTGAGVAHGLVAWFEMDLGGGVVLSNSPDNTESHWGQAFVAFDTPVPVTAGESLPVELAWREGRLSATTLN